MGSQTPNGHDGVARVRLLRGTKKRDAVFPEYKLAGPTKPERATLRNAFKTEMRSRTGHTSHGGATKQHRKKQNEA